jgi:hypothetical protein
MEGVYIAFVGDFALPFSSFGSTNLDSVKESARADIVLGSLE